MEEAKAFAEAYVTVVNFIGYAAGIAVGIGGETGKKLEANAVRALEAVRLIRPLTEAEAERKKIERWEEMAKNEQIGTIMAMEK